MNHPLWRLRSWRRKLWEALGSDRYSRPGPPEILCGLQKYLGSNGFFIEAGAVDGVFDSNTYYLERFCGWHGILIEPMPDMFRRLKTNRPRSTHYNCALVAPDFEQLTITMTHAHAISRVDGLPAVTGEPIEVPGRTLASIVEEVNPAQIDLLSLDVEGYEIPVLRGLDLDVHRPRYMVIECLSDPAKQEMDDFLAGRYCCVDQFTQRDFLFECISPVDEVRSKESFDSVIQKAM
jgi:FkbM family methyltransferase